MTKKTLKVATFNVKHGALENDYKSDIPKFLESLEILDVDILGLQEVDRGTFRSGFYDLARLAAKSTGLELHFQQTLKFKKGRYGNALLIRGKYLKTDHITMGGDHRFKLFGGKVKLVKEPRNAIFADVEIDGHKLTLANTHLSTNKLVRQAQLPQIMGRLSTMSYPQILMGDFNMSHKEIFSHIGSENYEITRGNFTYPSSNSRRAIDHIAVKGLQIISSETLKLGISDHLALVAEIE